MATGTEPFTIGLHVAMAFEDDDHYSAEDVRRYLRDALGRFPGRVEDIDVIEGRVQLTVLAE
jgi:hypothetical protein